MTSPWCKASISLELVLCRHYHAVDTLVLIYFIYPFLYTHIDGLMQLRRNSSTGVTSFLHKPINIVISLLSSHFIFIRLYEIYEIYTGVTISSLTNKWLQGHINCNFKVTQQMNCFTDNIAFLVNSRHHEEQCFPSSSSLWRCDVISMQQWRQLVTTGYDNCMDT